MTFKHSDKSGRSFSTAFSVFGLVVLTVVLLVSVTVFAASATTDIDKQTLVFNIIKDGILNLKNEIDISAYPIQASEINTIVKDIADENDIFYFDGQVSVLGYTEDGVNYITTVKPVYLYDSATLSAAVAKYKNGVAEIAAFIGATEGLSAPEKVLLLNEYFASNFTFIYNSDNINAYELLADKSGTAHAFSALASAVFTKLGFENETVVSSSGHEWNVVVVDGKKYHVDFAANYVSRQKGYSYHSYLLVSDAKLSEANHSGYSETPLCTDTTYDDMFWRNIYTRLAYLDGKWYYTNFSGTDNYSHLFSWEFGSATHAIVASAEVGRWTAFGNASSVYITSYSSVATFGGLLYYNTADKIYSYNPSTAEASVVLTADTSAGYIYGFTLDPDGLISYTVAEAFDKPYSAHTYQLPIPEYTVRFFNGSDTIVQKYNCGDTIVPPAADSSEWLGYSAGMRAYGDFTFNARNYSSYTYTFKDYNGVVIKSVKAEAGTMILPPPNPTRENDDTYSYIFKEWTGYSVAMLLTSDIEFTAEYTSTNLYVTLSFYDEDGVTLLDYDDGHGNIKPMTRTVNYGDNINELYDLSTWSDIAYTYVHDGWIGFTPGMIADKNYSFTVKWVKTLNKYTYKFLGEDLTTVIKDTEDNYGATLVPPAAAPVKPDDEGYTYSFAGWVYENSKGELKSYTDGLVLDGIESYIFSATYTKTKKSFNVTFLNDRGEILDTEKVEYLDVISNLAPLSDYNDVAYEYTFDHWDNYTNGMEITSDTVITAVYTKTLRQYSYTFVNYDDTVIIEGKTAYDTLIPAPATPTRPDEEGVSFAFDCWKYLDENGAEKVFDGNLKVNPAYVYKFVAIFKPVLDKCVVTIVTDTGINLSSDTCDYGTALTLQEVSDYSDDNYLYFFKGWSENYTAGMLITGDITITAMYDKVNKTCKVTLLGADGKVIDETDYAYNTPLKLLTGETLDYKDDFHTYKFKGWSSNYTEGMELKSDITITAEYEKTAILYTYKFLDTDKTTVLKEETAPFGTLITPPEAPVKAEDNTYIYVFNGWDGGYTEGMTLSVDCVFTPLFNGNVKIYTVTFIDSDGSLVHQDKLSAGSIISGVPAQKAFSDGTYYNEFVEWEGFTDGMAIFENVTFKAKYTQTPLNKPIEKEGCGASGAVTGVMLVVLSAFALGITFKVR